MLGKLRNSIALLSNNVLQILDGGLRLFLAGGGLSIVDSMTSRVATNHWQNISCSFKVSLRRSAVYFSFDLFIVIRYLRKNFNTFDISPSNFLQNNLKNVLVSCH